MAFPYYQNPYYQPHYQPQAQSTNVIWVNSETDARNYPVAPGNTVILMDNDNPVAYKKTTDFSGRAMPLEVFDLVKRGEEPADKPEYITKKEFDEFLDALDKRFSDITEQEIVMVKKKKEETK